VFLSIECELPREDSRRDHWHRRNRSQQQVIVGRGLGHRATSRNVDLAIAFGRCKGGGVTDVSVPSRGGIGRYVDVTIALGSARGSSIALPLPSGTVGESGVREAPE
jgi:hypothetical protein